MKLLQDAVTVMACAVLTIATPSVVQKTTVLLIIIVIRSNNKKKELQYYATCEGLLHNKRHSTAVLLLIVGS